mmetsp:Transcript_9376/g.29169  ORF Transcript_9376/g.29169 Transcript_9376/m.29169 type:complete len:80 (-) Transcript_9376:131-370(-)
MACKSMGRITAACVAMPESALPPPLPAPATSVSAPVASCPPPGSAENSLCMGSISVSQVGRIMTRKQQHGREAKSNPFA